MDSPEEKILNEVILAYRRAISERYDFEQLQKKYDLPPSFSEERMELLKSYFLTHVYPEPYKRAQLNDAFESLDNYTQNPQKILRVLADSVRILFKYGRHLPKILSAGLKALRSFKMGADFEQNLTKAALNYERKPPYGKKDLEAFIKTLSQEKIDRFIENNKALFETLHDRKLMKKIIEIVEHLIEKMKSRPSVYSQEEIAGLEIGRDIVREGNLLFESLNEQEQRELLARIIEIETDALQEVFEQ